MTNAELISKIRKEIISRIDRRRLSVQANNELVSLLSFLSTLESGKQEQKEVLPERGALIDANSLISRLDNLHNEYEEKFDQTGEVLFEQAMDVVEKVQRIVFDIRDEKKDG